MMDNHEILSQLNNVNSTFNGTTIADLGTVTTADINGGTIDGFSLNVSERSRTKDRCGSIPTSRTDHWH